MLVAPKRWWNLTPTSFSPTKPKVEMTVFAVPHVPAAKETTCWSSLELVTSMCQSVNWLRNACNLPSVPQKNGCWILTVGVNHGLTASQKPVMDTNLMQEWQTPCNLKAKLIKIVICFGTSPESNSCSTLAHRLTRIDNKEIQFNMQWTHRIFCQVLTSWRCHQPDLTSDDNDSNPSSELVQIAMGCVCVCLSWGRSLLLPFCHWFQSVNPTCALLQFQF